MRPQDLVGGEAAGCPQGGGAEGQSPFLGFIDFSASPFALGDILTWNVRVCCEALAAGKSSVDIVALTDPVTLGSAYQRFVNHFNQLPLYLDLAAAFNANPMLRNFTHLRDRASFERLMREAYSRGEPMFPGILEYERGVLTHKGLYCSHHVMNRFFHDRGFLPRLRTPQAYREQAEELLRSHGPDAFAVAVHVRRQVADAHSTSGGMVERDGNYDVWEAFFDEAQRRHPETVFVVLGRAVEWPRHLLRRRDIVLLKCLGLGLLDELAMIESCDLFMGLVSGPSTMAFFSDTPYALFVQEHYAPTTAAVVEVEEGAARLPFACANQTLLWEPPTLENLLAAFEEKYAALRGQGAPGRPAQQGLPGA